MLLAWRNDLGFAVDHDFFALVEHTGGNAHAKLWQLFQNLQTHGQRVADFDRLLKGHLLANINSARARQLARYGSADQCTTEHAVGNALFEHGGCGKFRVEVHRVVVTRHGRKKLNITLFDGFAVAGSLADFEGFVRGVGNLGHLAHVL